MRATARVQVEESLRRIEQLVGELDAVQDARARRAARDLMETVLDLHGVALARIAMCLSASAEGREIYAALGRDEQVRAVLLLYGLHPETAEERVRAVAELLSRELSVPIVVSAVVDGIARIRVHCDSSDWDSLCREVGRRLIDAAPDLDDIAIDRAVVQDGVLAAAAG